MRYVVCEPLVLTRWYVIYMYIYIYRGILYIHMYILYIYIYICIEGLHSLSAYYPPMSCALHGRVDQAGLLPWPGHPEDAPSRP